MLLHPLNNACKSPLLLFSNRLFLILSYYIHKFCAQLHTYDCIPFSLCEKIHKVMEVEKMKKWIVLGMSEILVISAGMNKEVATKHTDTKQKKKNKKITKKLQTN